MHSFDILSAPLDLSQNIFLEASAGTGKTFAIEHLIVRLLIEGDQPLSIGEILAVTFTKDAARDMKNRIRTNLEKLAAILQDGRESPFGYLKAVPAIPALQRVQSALFSFDEAQIFTIHGFCHQMLSEFAFDAKEGFEPSSPDSLSHLKLLHQTIKDYFLTGLGGQDADQMEKLVKKHRHNLESLIQKIMQKVQQGSTQSDEPLLHTIATECKRRFLQKSQKEERVGPDELLEKMERALREASFLQKVRGKYRAAIVDEFQDTDRRQYQIFKTLFLAHPSSLVVFVGDPKQSIYGFRSADLYTYLEAAAAFDAKNHAFLDTNFRSEPSLLKELNLLFSSAPGWNRLPKSEKTLHYVDLKTGREEKEKGGIHFFLAKTALGRARSWPTKELEENFFFPFIANEIDKFKGKIPYSEMALIIKDRYQAFRLHAYLQKRSIPASIKRTLNLAETPAFRAVEDLVRSLASPKSIKIFKVVLCGPLIGWGTHIDEEEERFIEAHKLWMLLQKSAVEEGFGPFFEKFLTSCFDTHSVCEKLLAHPQHALYPNLMQVASLLIEEEKQPYFSISKMASFLEELKASNPEEDPRLKVKEEEEDKVAILTLFASKGLEFELVFVLGLISRQSSQEGDVEERDAEKMRQLYVALTRAKKWVYIPFAFDESGKKVPFGLASALELFAARWGYPPSSLQEIYGRLPLKEEAVIAFLEKLKISYSWVKREEVPLPKTEEIENSFYFIPTAKPPLSFPKRTLVSFSSLSKKAKKEQLPMPQSSDKTIHTLPLGAETGTLLHAILEEIFSNNLQASQDFSALVLRKISKTSLAGWEELIALHIKELLNHPLLHVSLSELKEGDYMQEMEFLFPADDKMVKGFADLVFRREGKYYLLDWKSNWLGPSSQDYTEENMQRSMEENDYYLQAGIYICALKRYVKLFDNRPFSELFGGVFYYFLRGKSLIHFLGESLWKE